MRALTMDEVGFVSGGVWNNYDDPVHDGDYFVSAFMNEFQGGGGKAAFLLLCAGIGAALAEKFGIVSGAELGAAIGAVACAGGGPEASAGCAIAGGIVGAPLGNAFGKQAGAALGTYVGNRLWDTFVQPK